MPYWDMTFVSNGSSDEESYKLVLFDLGLAHSLKSHLISLCSKYSSMIKVCGLLKISIKILFQVSYTIMFLCGTSSVNFSPYAQNSSTKVSSLFF